MRLVGLDAPRPHEVGVTQRLTVNARAAGPRLGKQVQDVIRASKAGDWTADAAGSVVCGGVPLVEGEFTLETVVADGDAGAPRGRRAARRRVRRPRHRGRRRSWPPRGWPGTSSARCSRPAATPGCTSATGSCCAWPPDGEWLRRAGVPDLVAGETLA